MADRRFNYFIDLDWIEDNFSFNKWSNDSSILEILKLLFFFYTNGNVIAAAKSALREFRIDLGCQSRITRDFEKGMQILFQFKKLG